MALNSTGDKPQNSGIIREDGPELLGSQKSCLHKDIYELGKELESFVIAEGTCMGHSLPICQK